MCLSFPKRASGNEIRRFNLNDQLILATTPPFYPVVICKEP